MQKQIENLLRPLIAFSSLMVFLRGSMDQSNHMFKILEAIREREEMLKVAQENIEAIEKDLEAKEAEINECHQEILKERDSSVVNIARINFLKYKEQELKSEKYQILSSLRASKNFLNDIEKELERLRKIKLNAELESIRGKVINFNKKESK